MKRVFLSIVLLFIALLGAVTTAGADTHASQKVRIAAFNFYPTLFQAKDSSIQGFYVDFLNEIAKREGWNIEYVYGNWADGISRIKSGEVDVLTNVAFTAERAQFMDYGKIPLLTVWAELYVPTGSPIENIRDVKGKKIAVMKGDFNAANFKTLVEKFGIPCTYVEFGNFEEVFKAVSNRQVDGGIVNNTFGTAKQSEYSLRSSGVIFNPFDISFTVAKGKNSAILATLDKYLEEWRKSENSPYHRARERWSHGTASTIRVSHPWLKKAAFIFAALLCIAVGFVVLLRTQVRRKTDEIRKYSEELHIMTRQLEEELAERQVAQETLQEQAALLEEEISERYHVEEVLRESEQKYRLLFENMTTGFALHEMIYDAEGSPVDYRFLEVNPAFEKLTGITPTKLVGRTAREVTPNIEPYWIKKCGDVAMSGESAYLEDYAKQVDKLFDCWAFSPSKDRFAVIFSDVTERRQLQEQLNRAQKLDTIGRLAGGVAHDFNNKLSVILGYAELTKMRQCNTGKECIEYNNEIIKAGQHAQEITRRLLTFSRGDSVNPIKMDLNLALSEIKKTLGRMIGEHIILDIDLHQDIWSVRIDPTQFDQMITNLVVNSRDAMPDGGSITIATMNIVVDGDILNVPTGDYVLLSCSDTGCGMDSNTIEHIFEPFFTTKEVGKGTGLGLSSVYGIVRQNNGYITVYSEPGKGAMFSIFLPRISESISLAVTEDRVPERATQGTILLVEDEEAVRRITKLLIENMGYKVITAESPEHALSQIHDPQTEIHCILSDVVMPGMNGKVLYERVKAVKPDMPFLFMSGYPESIIGEQMMTMDSFELVQKPINYQLLGEKLAMILQAAV